MKEQLTNVLNELREINVEHEISNQSLDALIEELDNAKVCVPVIGRFSSGKSALINRLLGYRNPLLREKITKETAIPAEIEYTGGEEENVVYHMDGTITVLSDPYRSYTPSSKLDSHAKLRLNNTDLLGNIPDVMLVDMPGFESGYDVHDKAIDNYVTRSMAYIIVFPADDMTLTSSIGDILKELCLHNMPIYVVVTKMDYKTSEHEKLLKRLKTDLAKYVSSEIKYCEACGNVDKANTKEVVAALQEIQTNSTMIIETKYLSNAHKQIDLTKNYLTVLLNNLALSESALEEKEDKAKAQMESVQSKYSNAKDDFSVKMEDCIEEIKSDIRAALNQSESAFVTMLMDGYPINEKLNLVVRSACTESIKKRLLPKIEKYLEKVKNVVSGESIGDVSVDVYCNVEETGKNATAGIVAAIAATLLINPILGGLVLLFSNLVNRKKQEQQRQEAKAKIRGHLHSEVYPQVLDEIEKSLRTSIAKQADEMNATIEKDFQEQMEALKKAMETIREQRQHEAAQKQIVKAGIEEGLERIERLTYELQ